MKTESKYLTADDIISLGEVEKRIFGEVKKVNLSFDKVTVSILGSELDVIYGDFKNTFEIAISIPSKAIIENAIIQLIEFVKTLPS